MKNERVQDGGATDAIGLELERLCRSQPASRPDPAMQARVLERLARPRHRATAQLRPAFVAACVLLFAATASALWGSARRWLAPAPPAATMPAPPPERPTSSPASRLPATTMAPAPTAMPADPPPAHDKRHKLTVVPERVAPVDGRPVATPSPSSTAPLLDAKESLLVHSAVRALRVEGKTRRARALLSEYLDRFPRGALAEDAIALEIEAAMAERDQAAALGWATRYVDRFPQGRFRAVADAVLHQDSSKTNGDSRP